MRLILIKPRPGVRLKAALDRKRKRLEKHGGTFRLDGRDKWVHRQYLGWINLRRGPHGFVVAKTNTKVPEAEWGILSSFVSFLDRHFRDQIDWITIQYETL
ncbi:MAG: hypothetical protein QN178_10050 [Armatimonadota bacterium]|nr:hypothetical protein [Armatimonadota bacterium]